MCSIQSKTLADRGGGGGGWHEHPPCKNLCPVLCSFRMTVYFVKLSQNSCLLSKCVQYYPNVTTTSHLCPLTRKLQQLCSELQIEASSLLPSCGCTYIGMSYMLNELRTVCDAIQLFHHNEPFITPLLPWEGCALAVPTRWCLWHLTDGLYYCPSLAKGSKWHII